MVNWKLPVVSLIVLAAACGGGGDVPITPLGVAPFSPVATTVTVTPATMTIEAGSTGTVTATVLDQRGGVMTGQPVVWTSADVAIARVDAGVITGVAAGTAAITAIVAGRTGIASVVVIPAPIASVVILPPPPGFGVGQTVVLSASLRDRTGAVLTGRTVTWTSSAPAVATIDNDGRLVALSAGTTTITVLSEGVSATLVVPVSSSPGVVIPVVQDVSPVSLVPGVTIAINGSGFDAIASNNVVTIRGIRATLTSATATRLTVTVPCMASGPATILVTTNLIAGPPVVLPLAVPQRILAPGQSIILADGQCNELPPTAGNARYLLTVFSVSQSPENLLDFEVGGNLPAAGAAAVVIPRPQPFIRAAETASPESRRDRAHHDVLEWNRAAHAEGRAIAARLPAMSRSPSARAPLPALGDLRSFFHLIGTNCRDTLSAKIGTKAVYVGSRAIIWEDTANALRAADNPEIRDYQDRLGRIFDGDQYDAVRNTFGDPLRRDPLTDNDGRVHMVFTNRLSGSSAAAYVASCDQYPSTVFAASNFGEVFYGIAPTTKGSNLNNPAFPDGWFNFMARTVVHEVKHIASQAARVANGAPAFEQSWLEEGTARHAEEVWVRQYLHKVAWKANTGFGSAANNGIYCDFHPESGACLAGDVLRRPGLGMRRHFHELRNKLREPWNWSLYGDGIGQSGSVFYQTSWSLVRYAIDRYGSSDAAFLMALTSSTASGINNLANIAGVSTDQLLGGWGMALFTDDYPGLAANPDLQIPTWNFRDIYGSLNTDPTWLSTFTTPYPVQPVPLTFGSFSMQRTGVRGGAHAYFELSGASTTSQLLHFRNVIGGNLSANLRVAIARLQ